MANLKFSLHQFTSIDELPISVHIMINLFLSRLSESAVNAHEEHTLSTELLPPPADEKEHHATIYVINLYAVKNGSSNASEEMFQNEVVETLPDILGECKSTNDI